MSTRTGSLDFGSRSSIENVILDNRTTDPSVVAAGLFYYNTVTGYIRYCNGGAWMNVEHQSNRVNVWSDVPSTIKYPSEKLTKDSLDTITLALSTHNHNLNDLAEKSYNSLDDLPSLDFEPANANIQSHIGDGDIHVTSEEKSTWSGKQDALTFSTNIETDKASTTKVSAIKTFYDWAVGKFLLATKLVTSWSGTPSDENIPSEKLVYDELVDLDANKYDKNAVDLLLEAKEDITNKSSNVDTDKTSTTKYANVKAIYDWAVGKFIDSAKKVISWAATPSNDNIPSEKLVKDNLDLKADITPANGSTSALRALFIARGYDTYTNTYHCVYNTNTGYYEMNGLTDLTEAEMIEIYNRSNYTTAMSGYFSYGCFKARTNFPILHQSSAIFDFIYIAEKNTNLIAFEVVAPLNEYVVRIPSIRYAFYLCTNLVSIKTLNITQCTTAATVQFAFQGCSALVTCLLYKTKIGISFEWSPLLSLASLQYLVTNRANGINRITITVHPTVYAKLTDSVNYPTWNALLVDAVANKYIDFANASA